MQLTAVHVYSLVITLALVTLVGIGAAFKIKTNTDFTVGGRSSGPSLIAGTIIGTIVGGASTVGTAQLAFAVGLSAWWFTLGAGIALLVLAMFYAKPAIGTLLLAAVGSAAGLALGVGTMLSGDIVALLLKRLKGTPVLWITRLAVLFTTLAATLFTFGNLNSLILQWNFLSMGLRGGRYFPAVVGRGLFPGTLPRPGSGLVHGRRRRRRPCLEADFSGRRRSPLRRTRCQRSVPAAGQAWPKNMK